MPPQSEAAAAIVNGLLDQCVCASLGTINASGAPFVSLVNVARQSRGSFVMLLSGLAHHTKNIRHDNRCSMLVASPVRPDTDPLTSARVTLTGHAITLARGDDAAERSCLLKRHPSSEMYADFGDFEFVRFDFTDAHLVAGFGRIESLGVSQLSG